MIKKIEMNDKIWFYNMSYNIVIREEFNFNKPLPAPMMTKFCYSLCHASPGYELKNYNKKNSYVKKKKFEIESCLMNQSSWSVLIWKDDLNGSMQDCSISIANALEILQYCTKPSQWVGQ